MPQTPTMQEAEDFIRQWLSDGFGYAVESIRLDHVLAVDLGIAGTHGDQLLEDLHERFGTDFSELDADAGFGIEDRSPSGTLATAVSAVDRAVHGPPDEKHDAGDTSATDEWLDALVTVGDLVEAVHHGAWVSPAGPHRPGRPAPAGDPGKPFARTLGTLGRVSGRAFAERLRSQITRPSTLPDRGRRFPEHGFRRERVLRCAWCERRELVVLDVRYGGYALTCLACGKDSALRSWSRTMDRLPGIFGLNAAPVLLLGLPFVPWLLGHRGIGFVLFLVCFCILLALNTGEGQTRRLPDGAEPNASDNDTAR